MRIEILRPDPFLELIWCPPNSGAKGKKIADKFFTINTLVWCLLSLLPRSVVGGEHTKQRPALKGGRGPRSCGGFSAAFPLRCVSRPWTRHISLLSAEGPVMSPQLCSAASYPCRGNRSGPRCCRAALGAEQRGTSLARGSFTAPCAPCGSVFSIALRFPTSLRSRRRESLQTSS